MSAEKNFPIDRLGVALAFTQTSQALPLFGLVYDRNVVIASEDVMLYNPGPYTVHVLAGGADAVALAPGDSVSGVSMPLPPSLQSFGKGRNTHLAGKAVGGNQTIYAFLGSGA